MWGLEVDGPAKFREPLLDISQSEFEGGAAVWAGGPLGEDALTLHLQTLAEAFAFGFRGVEGALVRLRGSGGLLLFFHRFALPSARHDVILRCCVKRESKAGLQFANTTMEFVARQRSSAGHVRNARAVRGVRRLIVEIRGLKKVYGGKQSVVAIGGIDLSVPEGAIFGLLGPNGAGKTTTISVCTTRALPTAGQVLIADIDVVAAPSAARRVIGVVPQFNTLDRACTVFENIYFHCLFFGFSGQAARERANGLLEQFHLTERAKARPQELSGGLAQRVQIARAIAHRPKVLFLDEPSAGLDPQSRLAMWEAVRGLTEEGITVVLTTHYMEEADELCGRVAIIDHGKILVEDTPAALKNSIGAEKIYELDLEDRSTAGALRSELTAMQGVTGVEDTERGLRVLTHPTEGLLTRMLDRAERSGLRDLRINEPSLETVFIRLTGRDLRE